MSSSQRKHDGGKDTVKLETAQTGKTSTYARDQNNTIATCGAVKHTPDTSSRKITV